MSERGEAGRELDAEVAERVMGFAWEAIEANEIAAPDCTHRLRNGAGFIAERYRERSTRFFGGIRPYSSEIASAFLVVEAMIANGWRVYIDGPRFGDNEWRVMFAKDRVSKHAAADTLPLAICLSAIAALDASASQRDRTAPPPSVLSPKEPPND